MAKSRKLQGSKEELLKSSKIIGTSQSINENEHLLLYKVKWVKKRVVRECFGCGNKFLCSVQAREPLNKDSPKFKETFYYDYCRSCQLNGSRYIPRMKSAIAKSLCPECGDGLGWISFRGQFLRLCKLCYLTNQKGVSKTGKYFAP